LVTPVSEGILIGIQLFITILLLSIGFINRGESWLSKALLIIVSIILILLGLWVLIANKFTARIYAIDEIIVAFIAFYAYLKIPKPDKV
jgi:cellulose synthase/poly-beta-1,6-N-acetylglucosamine synthase-like glycosyltransferase